MDTETVNEQESLNYQAQLRKNIWRDILSTVVITHVWPAIALSDWYKHMDEFYDCN